MHILKAASMHASLAFCVGPRGQRACVAPSRATQCSTQNLAINYPTRGHMLARHGPTPNRLQYVGGTANHCMPCP